MLRGMSKLGLVLLSLGLLVGGCVSKSARVDVTINDGWRFIRQDVSGAERISFKDSSWKRIDLPHTWNNFDGQDGGNNYYRGPGWYRRRLTIPSGYAGKSIFFALKARCWWRMSTPTAKPSANIVADSGRFVLISAISFMKAPTHSPCASIIRSLTTSPALGRFHGFRRTLSQRASARA